RSSDDRWSPSAPDRPEDHLAICSKKFSAVPDCQLTTSPLSAVDTVFRLSLYSATTMDYKKLIREVPDYPKPGILFYDITTLLKDKSAFRSMIDDLTAWYRDKQIAKVVGIESRGFIVGGPLAHQLGAGFVPV